MYNLKKTNCVFAILYRYVLIELRIVHTLLDIYWTFSNVFFVFFFSHISKLCTQEYTKYSFTCPSTVTKKGAAESSRLTLKETGAEEVSAKSSSAGR